MTQGWLFKKAGGGEKSSWSPLRGKVTGSRSNWKRRWFRLEGTELCYYPNEPKTAQARKRDALYRGDLKHAQVDRHGELQLEVQWSSKSKRYVMEVPFKDRKLKMGTEAGEGRPKGSSGMQRRQNASTPASSQVEQAREKAKQVEDARLAGGGIALPNANGLARPQGQDYDGYVVPGIGGQFSRAAPPVPPLASPGSTA